MSVDFEKINQKYLNSIISAVPDILILFDAQGNYLDIWSCNHKDLIAPKSKLIGKNIYNILSKEIADRFMYQINVSLKDREIKTFEYKLEIAKKTKFFDTRLVPVGEEDEIGQIILSSIRNITQIKETEIELKQQKAYFEQLFYNSTEGIVLLDNNHHVLKVNKKFEKIFSYSEKEILGKDLDNYILPDMNFKEGRNFTKQVQNGHRIVCETVRKTKEGNLIDVSIHGFPIKLFDGNIGIYGLYNDITERKRKEKKIEYLSFHDPLTGLYNRRYFEAEIDRLNNSREIPISIIIGDIDRLKEINDNFGHKAGDRHIKRASEILDSVTRDEDIVARIGGDEFAIILPCTGKKETELFCKRIIKKIEENNRTIPQTEFLSISLGCAVMGKNTETLEKTFEKADNKMYEKKLK